MKKITKILSLTVVVAGIVAPIALLSTSSNNINVDQQINSVDANEIIETNNIDNGEYETAGDIIDANNVNCLAEDSNQNANTWMGITSGFVEFTIRDEGTNVGTVSVSGTDTIDITSAYLKIPSYITYNSKRYDVTSFDTAAFSRSPGLKGNLTIPASVTYIGHSAFYGCTGLTGTLTIPSSVASISDQAFYNCSGLTSLDLTNATSLTFIYAKTFYGCTGLTGTLTIPAGVTSIGNEAFNKNAFQDFKFLSENPPTDLGTNIFGTGVTKTLWVPSVAAKANYELKFTNFGLASKEYIKVVAILPTRVDITLSSSNPININLNDTGKKIATATAEVGPANATNKEVTWSIVENPTWLGIDSNGNITTKSGLSLGNYRFQVKATCKGDTDVANTAELVINVTRPATTKIDVSTSGVSQNVTLGENPKTLANCTATITPTNANPNVDWSITKKGGGGAPSWLQISSDGTISTNAAVTDVNLLPSQTYVIKATATDGSNVFGESDFTINFTKPAPTTITIAGVNATETIKANETLTLNPTVSSVAPDYASTDVNWTLSGNFPLGMTIGLDNGQVSYTPAIDHVTKTYDFNIIATTNVVGSSTQGTFPVQLTVNYADVNGVTVDPIAPIKQQITLGEAGSTLVSSCSAKVTPAGADQRVNWSIVNKPTWLTINQTTGQIDIASTSDIALLGNQTITVKATSVANSGATGTKPFTITFVRPTLTKIEVINLKPTYNREIGGSINERLDTTFTPALADANITWSLSNAPAGMQISPTGVLTYSATNILSPTTFSVIATDTVTDLSASVESTVTVTYAPVASVTIDQITQNNFNINLKSTNNNEIFNYTATVNPNTAQKAVNWNLTGDSVPAWLHIDINGKLYYDKIEDVAIANKTYSCNIIATSVGVNSSGATVSSSPLPIEINVNQPDATDFTIAGVPSTYTHYLGVDQHDINCIINTNPSYADKAATWSVKSTDGKNIGSIITINPTTGVLSIASLTDPTIIGTYNITITAIIDKTGMQKTVNSVIEISEKSNEDTTGLSDGEITIITIAAASLLATVVASSTIIISRKKAIK